jgi:hypothetical protein
VTLTRVADRPTWLLSRAHARAHRILRQGFEAEGVRGYHFRLLAAMEQYGPSSQGSTAATSSQRSTTSSAAGSQHVPPTLMIDAATS